MLVPEGTEIPQAVANKNQSFLWKIPQSLGSEFDFSEKFRVVLKTSDHIAAANKANAKNENNVATNNKDKEERQFFDAGLVDFLLVKNKNKRVTTADNASALSSMGAGPMVVQDRQFRIKGLTASPGGKPNPAKLTVNSVLPAAAPKASANTKTNTDTKPASTTANDNANDSDSTVKIGKPSSSENDGNVQAIGARSAALPNAHLLSQFTALLVIVLSATMGASFC